MKRFLRCLSLVLVLVMALGTVTSAQEISPRSSYFFASWDSSLYKTGSDQFQIWFDVVAMGGMDELGVSTIEVQRSSNTTSWTTVRTYHSAYYSAMIEEDTSAVCNYVTYTGTTGYYYRAYVTFYAKDYTGTGEMYDYSEVLYLPRT